MCIRVCISDAAVLLAGAVAGDAKYVLIDEYTSLLDRRTAAVRQYLYFRTRLAKQYISTNNDAALAGAVHDILLLSLLALRVQKYK